MLTIEIGTEKKKQKGVDSLGGFDIVQSVTVENNNNEQKQSMKKNANTNANRGPGRPMYTPKFPRSLRWTMRDFCEVNGVNPETGKGKACSKLTLIKFLDRDMHPRIKSGKNAGKLNKAVLRPDSVVIRLEETAKPESDSGLGRKAFLHCLRSRKDELKGKTAKAAVKSTRKAKTVTVDVGTGTADYEATKTALLAPAVDIAPAAPTPEVTAPAETPAATAEAVPAPAVEVAPAAEPVTA